MAKIVITIEDLSDDGAVTISWLNGEGTNKLNPEGTTAERLGAGLLAGLYSMREERDDIEENGTEQLEFEFREVEPS